ncbi:MAG TPA: twin-arginine translocase TatA/TatE family subunit [Rubrobacter sp.]|nr:twin-arginine translocase TatA/TatE family subunit [Rubrobacter sp.]
MGLALIPGLPTTGPMELIIVLVIILLLFGAKRVPELAKGLGTGLREFKRGSRGDGGEIEDKKEEEKKDEEKLTATEDQPAPRAEDDSSVEAEKAEQKRS